MKYDNFIAASGTAVDASQMYRMSVQVVSLAGATGSVQMQVSNDLNKAGYNQTATYTNWSALGSAVTVSGAAVQMVAPVDMCYRAVRMVYTGTGSVSVQIMAICG